MTHTSRRARERNGTHLVAGSLVHLGHVHLLEGNTLLLQEELEGLGVLLNLEAIISGRGMHQC